MIALERKTVFDKLRTYILVLQTKIIGLKLFEFFLQASFLMNILLESNALLLLRREAGTGYLPSHLEEWAMMGASGAVFAIGPLWCWFGRGKKQFALSACLGCTAISSLLVLAFPFIIESTIPAVELCGGDTISSYSGPLLKTEDTNSLTNSYTNSDNLAPFRIAFLIITVIMCTLTTVSIWAHGVTYIDDHNPQNGPTFYGVLISLQLSLGLNTMGWLQPSALQSDWWIAHLSISMVVLMFSVLFALSPNKMPQWRPIQQTDDRGFFQSALRMIRNKVLCVQILALSLLNAGLYGFIRLDDAYVQARFHVEAMWNDPQTSRGVTDIFRALVVVSFTMIFRIQFSSRSDGVKANTAAKVGGVITLFVAAFFGVIAVLNCPTGHVAGLEAEAEGGWQQPHCSWECRCDSSRYGFTPVCDIDTANTYFSPCSAGCNAYENLNGLVLFNNCTCGTNHVVRGSCTLSSCRLAYSAYQVLYVVVLALSAAAFIMQGMVVLRAVQRWDKSIAQGLAFSTLLFFTNIPGHVLYKTISHLTCAYEGNDNSACIFHRPSLWWAALTSAILAFLSAILSIVSSKMKRDAVITTTT